MSDYTNHPMRGSAFGQDNEDGERSTVGPWSADKYGDVRDEYGGLVAEVWDDLGDTARLIAASPTMRNALAGIVAMGCWVPVGEGGTRCAFCHAVNDETHDRDCAFVAAVNALSEADGTL